METKDRIRAFAALGKVVRAYTADDDVSESHKKILDDALEHAAVQNPWFTRENIRQALSGIGEWLHEEKLSAWLEPYNSRISKPSAIRSTGIVMAGNIPMVGFHDLLCVMISGKKAVVKLSSRDAFLIPALYNILTSIETGFNDAVVFSDSTIKGFDAVITMGGDQSSRYFETYFSQIPHLIRAHRNSAAVLSGNESHDDLSALCRDIFSYFGLGCRSVSHLFVPAGYSFDPLLRAAEAHRDLSYHHKFASNYMYYKTIYQMNSGLFWDNGIVLLRESDEYDSPVSVLYYSEYKDVSDVIDILHRDSAKLQCVVSVLEDIPAHITPGHAQLPALDDYADGLDTMDFLNPAR
jgi:hypothetical protein